MEEFQRHIERMLLQAACKESDLPDDITELMDSLVESGCPVRNVLAGMVKFGERMKEKNDVKKREELEDLKELLKGLPIILDEEE